MENQKGMTLVELMFAVVIISLALLTMLDMFDLGLNTTSKAEKETKAVGLAQKKIEESKYLINNNETVATGRTPFPEEENAGYEYNIVLSTRPDIPDLQNIITVTVYYDNDKNVVLVTGLGDR